LSGRKITLKGAIYEDGKLVFVERYRTVSEKIRKRKSKKVKVVSSKHRVR
jgi:hypothetical protein